VRTMRFNGLYAQVEFRSDVLGSKSTSKQFDYFEFSIGEPVSEASRYCHQYNEWLEKRDAR
jgi:hypothetical protein